MAPQPLDQPLVNSRAVSVAALSGPQACADERRISAVAAYCAAARGRTISYSLVSSPSFSFTFAETVFLIAERSQAPTS